MRKSARQVVLMLSFLWLFIGMWSIIYAQAPGINDIGGFEGNLPSFWTMGNQPAGVTLSWATDQYRTMGHSLKIVKPTATSDSAAWVSTNMCNVWSEKHPQFVDIMLGAYVKTEGVNTNPASDDQKWYIAYTFYDTLGYPMRVTKLPINQSVTSSTGFVADTNGVGESTLPKDAYTTIVTFVAGKNATGTVWADDFVFNGRAGAWAGQDWNTSVGVPTGWYYWLPPIGGNDGVLNAGFENTVVTTEAAHSGTKSLKFHLPFGRDNRDGFVGTLRYPLDANITPGTALKINVWIKAANLVPDSAKADPGSWSVGVTPLYFTGTGDNYGYAPFDGAKDYAFTFPDTAHQFDWTLFSVTDTVPINASKTAKFLEVRLHVYNRFVGTVYFDDLTVSTISGINDQVVLNPKDFTLFQNYPNPFNPSTSFSYNLPKASNVTVKIYDLLGNEVKTLVSGNQIAGLHQTSWNGDNNSGNKVASGTYIYTLKSNDGFTAKKMTLLK
jgi:FlgD Ig-like domain